MKISKFTSFLLIFFTIATYLFPKNLNISAEGVSDFLGNNFADYESYSISENVFSYNGINYALQPDGTLSVISPVDPTSITKAEIVAELNGIKVTSISHNAFANCQGLVSVSIPKTVLTIGNSAFSGCYALSDLSFGNGIVSIGAYSFYGCSSLENLNLPDSLQSVDIQAFDHCSALTTVTLPKNLSGIENKGVFAYCANLKEIKVHSENKSYCSENGVLFTKDKSCIVEYPAGKTESAYAIPTTVKTFGSCTFAGNPFLKSVIIPNGVTEIGFGAFSWSNLEQVTIPATVSRIDEYAFTSCYKLKNIYYSGTSAQWAGIVVEASNDSLNQASVHFNSNDFLPEIINNNIVYAVQSDGTLSVIRPVDSASITKAEIAAEINGIKVTSISHGAFANCQRLVSVSIPETVLTIGNSAFSGCYALSDLSFGNGVVSIGAYSFYGCSSLENLNLPDSLQSVDIQAFDHCSALTTVTLPKNLTGIENKGVFAYCASLKEIKVHRENKSYCSENGVLFTKDKSCIVEYPAGKTESAYAIPTTVKTFGSCTFAGNPFLKSVIIPNGVTEIGFGAFSWTNLEQITIPASVLKINEYAFTSCYKLKNIYYSGTSTQWSGIVVEASNDSLNQASVHFNSNDFLPEIINNNIVYAVQSDGTLSVIRPVDSAMIKTAEIASEINGIKVTSISNNAFVNCKNLISVHIPETVLTIGDYAFNGCSALSDLRIAEGVEYIGTYAFYGCSSLSDLVLPDSLTSVGKRVFDHCSKLQVVIIPKNLTGLEDKGLFAYCGGLKEIKVDSANPNYYFEMGVLFNKNKSCIIQYPAGKTDNSYVIPPSIKSFGSCTFSGSSLKSVTVSDGVSEIGFAAFAWCGRLNSVYLPAEITKIDNYAFWYCNNLKDIYFGGTEEQWLAIEVGFNNEALKQANVHYNYVSEYKIDGIIYSLNSKGTLTVTGPVNIETIQRADIASEINGIKVTDIAKHAFSDCEQLESVKIPGSISVISAGAFYNCPKLTNLKIEEGVAALYDYAFYACVSLEKLELPDSIITLHWKPFDHCSGLKSVTIPKNVKNIVGAFAYCANLTEINADPESPYFSSENGILFNKDKTCIVEYPAGRKDKYYSVPDTVNSMAYFVFAGCNTLERVVLPQGLTELNWAAFSWCGNIKEITIPASVTKINEYAISGCSRISDIYFGGTEEQWNSIEVCANNESLLNAHIHFEEHKEAIFTVYTPLRVYKQLAA